MHINTFEFKTNNTITYCANDALKVHVTEPRLGVLVKITVMIKF